MAEQYFSRRPTSTRKRKEIHALLRNHPFTFWTDAGVFSRDRVDRGSELLLQALEVGACELILDLGCGYGVLGIVAARLSEGGRVILTDVNERALALVRANLETNRVTNAEVRLGDLYEPVAGLAFDHILCNPPIRAGRRIVDRMIRGAPEHLHDGGKLWLVARTKQGADSLRARMAEAFGNADVVKRGSGFKVLRSIRRA